MHGVMIHHMHGEGHPPSTGSISQEDLERIIALEHPCRAREWLAQPDGAVLTFDDGLRSQELALPVLEAHGLTAMWFICCGRPVSEVHRSWREAWPDQASFHAAFEAAANARHAVPGTDLCYEMPSDYLANRAFYSLAERRHRWLRDEMLTAPEYDALMREVLISPIHASEIPQPWLTRGQVLALAKAGHVLGLHTYTHPTRLDRMERHKARQEWTVNATVLGDWTRRAAPFRVASYPYGLGARVSFEALRDLGVQYAFRADMGRDSVMRREYDMPRVDCADLRIEGGA